VSAVGLKRTSRPLKDPPCFSRTVAVGGRATGQAVSRGAKAGGR
jgi:hypothetical protein